MSDEESYYSAAVETSRSAKRRRLSDSDNSNPRYSSPDELGANDDHHTPRRNNRLSSNGINTRRHQATTEPSHDRSPSPDELDHTFYADDDVRSQHSEDRTRSREDFRSRSRTPSSTRSPEDEEPRETTETPELVPPKVKEVRYKLKYELEGHDGGISQVKFSPDGQWIASASADSTIKIWEAATGKLVYTLAGHLAGISTVAWSPDSQTIASGSDDKTIRLWDLATGEPYPKPWKGHHNYVYSIAFSPKGNMLVSGSYDEAVFLWDVRAGRQMRSLPAHSDPVGGVDFIRDGTLVVSCAGDGLIRIWDTASGQCLRTIVHEDNAGVVSVKFSPNGKYVLAWTLDGSIRLWDYVTGHCKKTYQGHVNNKYSIGGAFGVYGTEAFVVSGSEDGRIVFWDVKSKKILQELEAHDGVVMWVDTHPTRDRIVSCGLDNKVKLWINEDEDDEDVTDDMDGFEKESSHDMEGECMGPNHSTNRSPGEDSQEGKDEAMDEYVKVELDDDTLQKLPSRPR